MLAGKSALVTGSLGGIGFATAGALATEAVASCRTELPTPQPTGACGVVEGARRTCRVSPIRPSPPEADHIDDKRSNARRARHFGAVENFLPEHWNKALMVNLSLPLHAIRLTLPGMKAKD